MVVVHTYSSWRILVDAVCVIIALAAVVYLNWHVVNDSVSIIECFIVRYAPPNKRGVFCDDRSLYYPRHSTTVPLLNIILIYAIIGIVSVVGTETHRHWADKSALRPRNERFVLCGWHDGELYPCASSSQ